MLVFLWILCSLGVAYGAKISGRNLTWWLVFSLALSPLVGSIALFAAQKLKRRRA